MSNQEILNTQEKREYVWKIADKHYHNNKAKNEELLYLLMQRLLTDGKDVRKQFVEKLMKKMFVSIEPAKVDVMERFLTRYYRDEEGNIKEEKRKIGEIVSQDKNVKDYWETNGKKLLTHQGILKCADFVGVKFSSPEVVDKPNSNNDKGFFMIVEASSENRIPTIGAGSANDKSSQGEISNSYKFEMAHKRAVDRAFLAHVGLHDVYSSEEADSWSVEEMLRKQVEQQRKQMQQVIHQGKAEQQRLNQLLLEKDGEVKRRNGFIDRMLAYVSLPEDDNKYPNTRILTIIEKEDYEYVEQLKTHEDVNIAYTAKRLLALHGATIEQREEMEQVQKEAEKEITQEQDEKEAKQIVEQTETDSTPKKVENQEGKPFTLENITEEITEEPNEKESVEENDLISEKKESEEVVKKEVTVHAQESKEEAKPFQLDEVNNEIGDINGLTTLDYSWVEEEKEK